MTSVLIRKRWMDSNFVKGGFSAVRYSFWVHMRCAFFRTHCYALYIYIYARVVYVVKVVGDTTGFKTMVSV